MPPTQTPAFSPPPTNSASRHVHLAIGTDIPNMHRTADGAALGSATYLDFRLFCSLVQQMHPAASI